jgi:hypothetical protein
MLGSPEIFMAIYATFFVMSASVLVSGLPDWKQPLPEAETRVVTTFFGTRTIQTREPRFEKPAASFKAIPKVKTAGGDYADYLETRLPDFVTKAPHWATKGLTPVELDPLGKLVDGRAATHEALFGPPPQSSTIYEFRKDVLRAISVSPDEFARKWAAEMSGREHTHSQTGVRVSPDWSIEDASRIIQRLCALLPRITDDESLYLLVES